MKNEDVMAFAFAAEHVDGCVDRMEKPTLVLHLLEKKPKLVLHLQKKENLS